MTPDPTADPPSSTLNFPVGDTRANGLTAVLTGSGQLSIVFKALTGTTNVLLDVTGYYRNDPSGLLYYPVTPARLMDTRAGVLATALAGTFKASIPRTLTAAGRAGLPLTAAALTGNLTVVGQTAGGYASITEAPTASPTTSTINFPLGDTRANGVDVPLDGSGHLSLVYKTASGKTTNLLLDVTGYYQ